MSTEIKVWQLKDGELVVLDDTMQDAGRTEVQDLQSWIRTDPSVLGRDLLIIGEQVQTKSGPMDFLGIDSGGNTVVVELKRGRLPREALTQAIDYASDVATWDLDRLGEECLKYHQQSLEAYLNENLESLDLEDQSLNAETRILLVGTEVEEALQRMVEWLSDTYGMSINAVVLRYIRTESDDELLARTMIIPEDVVKERSRRQTTKIPMSDEPGSYDEEELRSLLSKYLAQERHTPRRIRECLLPLCLEQGTVTRDDLKRKLVAEGEAEDEGKAGIIITGISREIGFEDRDYLRQVIRYDKPQPWEKDNYRIEQEYHTLVRGVLDDLAAETADRE